MRIFFKYVFWPILSVIFGRGVLVAIHKVGYQPEIWLGNQLVAMYSEISSGETIWVVSAVIGLSLYMLELKFKPIEKLINLYSKNERFWFERDQLELYVIACLASDRRPKLPVDKEPVLSRHRLLKDAISDGSLTPTNLKNGEQPNVWTRVRISDFAKFAEKTKHDDFIRVAKIWKSCRENQSTLQNTVGENAYEEIGKLTEAVKKPGTQNNEVTKLERINQAVEEYRKRGTPVCAIDSYSDLTEEQKAEIYDAVMLRVKGRLGKSNKYRKN
jgi:hypothetical protein